MEKNNIKMNTLIEGLNKRPGLDNNGFNEYGDKWEIKSSDIIINDNTIKQIEELVTKGSEEFWLDFDDQATQELLVEFLNEKVSKGSFIDIQDFLTEQDTYLIKKENETKELRVESVNKNGKVKLEKTEKELNV